MYIYSMLHNCLYKYTHRMHYIKYVSNYTLIFYININYCFIYIIDLYNIDL